MAAAVVAANEDTPPTDGEGGGRYVVPTPPSEGREETSGEEGEGEASWPIETGQE